MRMRQARGRVDVEHALARRSRALEAFTRRRISPFGDVYVYQRERLGRAQCRGIECKRLLKVARRALKPSLVETVERVTSTLVEVVSQGALEYRARWQIDTDRHLQRAHEAGRDLVLDP